MYIKLDNFLYKLQGIIIKQEYYLMIIGIEEIARILCDIYLYRQYNDIYKKNSYLHIVVML